MQVSNEVGPVFTQEGRFKIKTASGKSELEQTLKSLSQNYFQLLPVRMGTHEGKKVLEEIAPFN